jgi:signal transduction histidine kinase
MMEERFGAIGNDRYRQYLKDINSSGGHIMSLVNDLLDLSKIEAGRLELAFVGVALNDLIEQCVALMQPQANREGIILRTSLSPRLPDVIADARSLRQIVLNLVTSSIKLTGAGGQVIVSTARAENGALILRVRDTGAGMSAQELADALEPLQQVSSRSGGSGIGLPLAKALAEANGASLRIESNRGSGTLIEVTFPRERVGGE